MKLTLQALDRLPVFGEKNRAGTRKKIGKVTGDSTDIIREWRDNDEPYR